MITLRRLAAAQYKGLRAIDLTFPEQGSILIEGRNEAGKSTLFDAVHFALYGVPLVGDIGSAIHFGADQMEVDLSLDVAGTALAVRRRAKQTAKTLRSEAELEVRRGDESELVKGAREVTQRLQQELGGLTAEALLNSCLVAQKQLGRLETLDRSEREKALSVLLNLGKLSDVQNALRFRPQDEEELRRARARVEVAKVAQELAALEARRGELLRQQRLIAVRQGSDRLMALQEALAAARTTAIEQEARLAALRQKLAQAETLRAKVGQWQHVADVAGRCAKEERQIAEAVARVAAARAAAAELPAVRRALDRHREARKEAQALAECRAREGQYTAEIRRAEERLAERAQKAERAGRLEEELEGLRRKRHELVAQINALAPALEELQHGQARLTGLNELRTTCEALQEARSQFDELQATAAERVEVEERYLAIAVELEAAQGLLAGVERQRAAAEAYAAQEQALTHLAHWREKREALDAAAAAKRLMADLSLGVLDVAHVAVTEGAAGGRPEGGAGLELSLIVNHPLTGALRLRLQLSQGRAALVETRPATADEAAELRGRGLPSLSAIDDTTLKRDLAALATSLRALRQPVPRDAAQAAERMQSIQASLGTPPVFEQEHYVQAREAVAAEERALAAAQAALAALPPEAALARNLAEAELRVSQLGQALGEGGRRWQVVVSEVSGLQDINAVIAEQQGRCAELSTSVGRREGLEGQLAAMERNGKERMRELREYQTALEAETEAALSETGDRLRDELERCREQTVSHLAAIGPLVASVEVPEDVHGASSANGAVPAKLPAVASGFDGEEVDLAALQAQVQARIDALGQRAAVLEEQAAALEEAEGKRQAANSALHELKDDLALAMSELAEQAETSQVSDGKDGVAPLELLDDGTAHEPAPRRAGGKLSPVAVHEAPADISPAQALARAGTYLEELRASLSALDEVSLRAAEREAQRSAGGAEASAARILADAQMLASNAVTVCEQLGVAVTDLAGEPAEVAAHLLEACPDAAAPLPPAAEVEASLRTLDQQAGHLERGRQDAAALLGDAPAVSLEEAERALGERELDQAARRRALDIVTHTRQRMINKVLPDTITNMCLLLPQLTAGRYRYAELSPDYRLQVWDERKHGYVEKNLFSGGTQDQFSLALRLGFALAALPRELGTSPGFLFLDEPLSSFDLDRTQALIDLLTSGQIATFFKQVFLISHSQAFDPACFSHHILMEDGAVSESSLPAVATA